MSLSIEQIAALKSQFSSLQEVKSVTNKPSKPSEVEFVIKLLVSDIGINVAFEIRTMSAATKSKLATQFGFSVNTPSHELSLAIAKILRASKERDVKVADKSVVLINEPQLAHQPSKWAVMSMS